VKGNISGNIKKKGTKRNLRVKKAVKQSKRAREEGGEKRRQKETLNPRRMGLRTQLPSCLRERSETAGIGNRDCGDQGIGRVVDKRERE